MGFDTNIPLDQRKRRPKAGVKLRHDEVGYPHYSSRFPGFCMCNDTCCQGDAGCKCKSCPCHTGYEHGVNYADETPAGDVPAVHEVQ